ncbi:MAG TPA: hypothetical protein VHM19_05875, partial [Polyangiales bacterium]|nr:hypothetical protein [Polyangiales bacterium]
IHAMTLEVITVACAGDCADVLAVAHGGHPPYAFRWDDGSTRAQRRVCPEAAATYGVDATDSAVTSDEFHYDAHTVHAELGATVSSCSGDGGVPSGDALCVTNPSFEGTPQVNLGTAASFDASPWHGCAASGGTPDIIAQNTLPFALGATFPAPTDGATYLRMACALGGSGSPDVHEMTTQQLCAPLLAGHTYSFLIDAMASHEQPGGSLAKLVVRGASSDCGDGEPLWASPPLAADWTTLCVTLRPADDTPYLTLYPDGDVSMGATLLVDNLRPVVACP